MSDIERLALRHKTLIVSGASPQHLHNFPRFVLAVWDSISTSLRDNEKKFCSAKDDENEA